VTQIRRVITGESPEGKGIFRVVEAIEPVASHFDWYGVWGWDAPLSLPIDPGTQSVPTSSFPPVDNPAAVRVSMVEFPPMSDPKSKPRTDDEVARMLRGGRVRERDTSTGMHRTDSVEVAFVISGEMCLEQDDGAEVVLKPGDCLVQNGARHAWKNRSDGPCLIGFVTFAAERNGGR
jgi:mannose-6-phosphate isomerase-like protein (cupin superfamily)